MRPSWNMMHGMLQKWRMLRIMNIDWCAYHEGMKWIRFGTISSTNSCPIGVSAYIGPILELNRPSKDWRFPLYKLGNRSSNPILERMKLLYKDLQLQKKKWRWWRSPITVQIHAFRYNDMVRLRWDLIYFNIIRAFKTCKKKLKFRCCGS